MIQTDISNELVSGEILGDELCAVCCHFDMLGDCVTAKLGTLTIIKIQSPRIFAPC